MVKTLPCYSIIVAQIMVFIPHCTGLNNNKHLVVKVTSTTIAGSFVFMAISGTVEKCYSPKSHRSNIQANIITVKILLFWKIMLWNVLFRSIE